MFDHVTPQAQLRDFCRDPQIVGPVFKVRLPYHFHTLRTSYGSGMGMGGPTIGVSMEFPLISKLYRIPREQTGASVL